MPYLGSMRGRAREFRFVARLGLLAIIAPTASCGGCRKNVATEPARDAVVMTDGGPVDDLAPTLES